MEDLRLDSLAGVGPVTTKKLSDAGMHNIMDLIVRGPVAVSYTHLTLPTKRIV